MINIVFLWCILAKRHPSEIRSNRVSNYGQYFDELNIQGFDFPNGFKCRDMHRFQKINKLSVNLFELNFCQDQNKWKHKK